MNPVEPQPFGDAHQARQETFLARYPRNLKLAVVLLIIVIAVTPWFLSKMPQRQETAHGITEVKANSETASQPTSTTASPSVASGEISSNADTISNDTDDRNAHMIPSPAPSVTEDTAEGNLPKIGENGEKAWQIYARPFKATDKRPRIALIISELGLSRVATDATLQHLPANVTLAFDVQSPVVGAWLGRARQDGHETILSVPMEPFDYPRSDPGPNTLLSNLPNSDNLQRLYWAMRQGSGYVGITTFSGSRFTTNPEKVTSLLETLKTRGLLVFDAHVAPHSTLAELAKQMNVPSASATQKIDANPSPEAIDLALNQLEQTARLSGRAIGVASPLPITLDHLDAWIKQLPSHGIALAPLSAMVQ